jgi:multimeric flavodoxin WrbA
MKTLTILGSPRTQGNTATALSWVEDELRSKSNLVERVNIVDYEINGCNECYACRSHTEEPGCSQQDDAELIFERMRSADVIVYASPLFSWGWTSHIKPLIDRHFCLVTGEEGEERRSLLAGRLVALFVTAAGPVEGNADLILEMFNRLAEATLCTVASTLVIPYCTTPNQMGDDVRCSAVRFAYEIIQARP